MAGRDDTDVVDLNLTCWKMAFEFELVTTANLTTRLRTRTRITKHQHPATQPAATTNQQTTKQPTATNQQHSTAHVAATSQQHFATQLDMSWSSEGEIE